MAYCIQTLKKAIIWWIKQFQQYDYMQRHHSINYVLKRSGSVSVRDARLTLAPIQRVINPNALRGAGSYFTFHSQTSISSRQISQIVFLKMTQDFLGS